MQHGCQQHVGRLPVPGSAMQNGCQQRIGISYRCRIFVWLGRWLRINLISMSTLWYQNGIKLSVYILIIKGIKYLGKEFLNHVHISISRLLLIKLVEVYCILTYLQIRIPGNLPNVGTLWYHDILIHFDIIITWYIMISWYIMIWWYLDALWYYDIMIHYESWYLDTLRYHVTLMHHDIMIP